MKSGAKKFFITTIIIAAACGLVVYFFKPDWGTLWRRLTGASPTVPGTPGQREVAALNGAKVVAVFDGDTFAVEFEGINQIVQAIGINAPEAGNTGQAIECHTAESHRRAVELLSDKTVELKADADYPAEDGYGRLLRYIILPGGRAYNKLMLEEGMAYEYANFAQRPYSAREEFRQAEVAAKIAGAGLWAKSACGG